MVTIDASKYLSGVEAARASLGSAQVTLAIARSLNRTTTRARTAAVKDMRAKYPGLKAGVLKQQLSIGKATRAALESRITAAGPTLPLEAFSPIQRQKGVSVRIGKRRKTVNSAFITRKKQVRARGEYKEGGFKFRKKRVEKTGPDYAAPNLRSISAATALGNELVVRNIQSLVSSYMPGVFENEIKFRTARMAARR